MESLSFIAATTIYSLINYQYKPEKKSLNIIIAGPPGSGKGKLLSLLIFTGTVSESIIEEYGLVHVATGDLIRLELKKDNAWSKDAKSYVDAGKLVPQSMVNPLLKEKMDSYAVKTNGYILDGYPRSQENFDTLKEMNLIPDLVLLVEVSDELSIARQSGRVSDPVTGATYHLLYNPPPNDEIKNRCTQRSTDNAEKAKDRLAVYHQEMSGFSTWYPNAVKIDGSKSIETVWKEVKAAIESAIEAKGKSKL